MNNIGAATSAASGVGSLLFGQRMSRANARYQMKLQKELMATQQSYAVQNAATDYFRQRELMQDTSLLTKLGRQKAGLSTAGDYNNVSASAPQISSPSAPSSPSLTDPNQFLLSGAKQIQDSVTSLTQQRAAAAQAEGLEMQNEITRKALNEKVLGAKGEGLKANAEGKKAVATLPSDVQKAKDDAQITNNNLWKSENDAAYASANAMSSANALLAQSLTAHEMYEKAKADKSMSQEQLQLFKDTYDFGLQAAQQNVVNLRKQGAAIDAAADASRASAAASRASAAYLHSQQIGQDISNAVNSDPKVMDAARTRLINAAKDAGPQSFGEYAWSVINNPHATTAQKWKAAGASILGFFERAVGGAANTAGRNLGDRIITRKK